MPIKKPGLKRSTARRMYVRLMMEVVGRALQATSEVDRYVQEEAAVMPDDFIFEMTVMPGGPALVVQKQAGGRLRYLGQKAPRKPDLSIQFKHLTHAFLVLSFQEKTSLSFAHDRILVDGDLGHALRVTRILNQLEAYILPRFIADRAVKEYPVDLSLSGKLRSATRIYLRMAGNLFSTVKAS